MTHLLPSLSSLLQSYRRSARSSKAKISCAHGLNWVQMYFVSFGKVTDRKLAKILQTSWDVVAQGRLADPCICHKRKEKNKIQTKTLQRARNVVADKEAGRLLIWSAAQVEINFHLVPTKEVKQKFKCTLAAWCMGNKSHMNSGLRYVFPLLLIQIATPIYSRRTDNRIEQKR